MSTMGSRKPTNEDFVLPPAPSNRFTSQVHFVLKSPHQSNQNPSAHESSWSSQTDDLPLPPPPSDLPQNPSPSFSERSPPPVAKKPPSRHHTHPHPSTIPTNPPPSIHSISPPPPPDPDLPSFLQSDKPKMYRSVARPASPISPPPSTLPSSPPPSSHPISPPPSDPNLPSFLQADKPKVYRSVARPVNKKSESPNKAIHEAQNSNFDNPPSFRTPQPDNSVPKSTYSRNANEYQSKPAAQPSVRGSAEPPKLTQQTLPPRSDGAASLQSSSLDNPKRWYKSMLKEMQKANTEDSSQKSLYESQDVASNGNDGSYRQPSFQPSRPTKVGRITDYKPAEPYVVENIPVKLNLNQPYIHNGRCTSSNSTRKKNTNSGKIRRSSSLDDFSKIEWSDFFDDIGNKTPEPDSPLTTPAKTTPSYNPTSAKGDFTFTSPYAKPEPEMPDLKPKKVMNTKTRSAAKPLQQEKDPELRQPARAKFDFVAQTSKEYGMKKGQTVIITKQVDSNWYMVQSTDGVKEGIVPVTYVELMGSSPEKPRRNGQARAKFDFAGSTKNELAFKKGDEIVLLKRVDDNWYKGKISGKTGILPLVYVEVILEPESESTKESPKLSLSSTQNPPNTNHGSKASHSQQSSVVSQTSSDEPDENERKGRAAFLANSAVRAKPPHQSGERTTHRQETPGLKRSEVVKAAVQQDSPTRPVEDLSKINIEEMFNFSELDKAVEALSSKNKSNFSPSPKPVPSAHVTPPAAKPLQSTARFSPSTANTHVTSPPAHVTSPPAHVTSPPAHVTSPPAHVTSPPAHVTSPPAHVTSPPAHVTSPPAHLTSPPAHVTSPPAHVTLPPAHVTSPPAHVTSPPAHVTSPPAHVTSPQAHVTHPPVLVSPPSSSGSLSSIYLSSSSSSSASPSSSVHFVPSHSLTPSVPSYPSSNMSTQPSSPVVSTPPTSEFGHVIGCYVTLYAYEASNEDELDLEPGDLVTVVETCDDGWYVGTCQRTGSFGTFPGNYVSLTNTS